MMKLQFQLIENKGQVFKLYSEIRKVRDNCKFKPINLEKLTKDVTSRQEYREKVTKAKTKIDNAECF